VTAPITWAEASAPIYWSNIGIDWNSPAKANSSAFAVTSGYSNINIGSLANAVSFTNNMGKVHASTLATSGVISFGVQNGYTSAGGFTFDSEASFALTQDYTSSSILTAVGVVTIPINVTYVNNTNHADSITIGSTVGVTSSDSFLWSDVSDPTTVWTEVDYPN
jgi:hypothetical protein